MARVRPRTRQAPDASVVQWGENFYFRCNNSGPDGGDAVWIKGWHLLNHGVDGQGYDALVSAVLDARWLSGELKRIDQDPTAMEAAKLHVDQNWKDR